VPLPAVALLASNPDELCFNVSVASDALVILNVIETSSASYYILKYFWLLVSRVHLNATVLAVHAARVERSFADSKKLALDQLLAS
jgi:hypothetical protein